MTLDHNNIFHVLLIFPIGPMLFGFTVIKIFAAIGFILSKLIRKRHLKKGRLYDFLQDPLSVPYAIMVIIGIPCAILLVITESVYFAIPLVAIVIFGILLLISIIILGGFVYDMYGPVKQKQTNQYGRRE